MKNVNPISDNYPTASQLLTMDVDTRERLMAEMMGLAESEDFEIFAAYGEEEF